jgi:hypothetical protein
LLVLALLLAATLALAALRVRIAIVVGAIAAGLFVAARLGRRSSGILLLLRRLLLLLATRTTLPRLGATFAGGALAAIVRFVFGHGQSSLGAVAGTGEGRIEKKRAEQHWLRALGLR